MIKHEISNIQKHSIADELGILSGDFLLAINGREVSDILDYRFRIQEDSLLVEIEKHETREIWELDIEKDPDEDLGLTFKQSLMSHKKRCHNKCIFCFVDQQPKDLRPSLYIKDDDPRLSFLIGNYVTLTNLGMDEIKRLAGYHLSPLRISVHTADLDLRERMMGTPAARNLFDTLAVFSNAGIKMHFQIVLCKGVNDGKYLDETIEKLVTQPGFESLAIVPAGLTKHRDGLFPLQPFTKEDAQQVIEQGQLWQNAALGQSGTLTLANNFKDLAPYREGHPQSPANFHYANAVYLSDEWYIMAGVKLPPYEHYRDFPQLDNGVGVLRLFWHEFVSAKKIQMVTLSHHLKKFWQTFVGSRTKNARTKGNTPGELVPSPRIGIITGRASYKFMRHIAKHWKSKITVYPIDNHFFGETVTVSGLLTGVDIINQLKNRPLPDIIFIPENAFRAGVKEKIMLDGTTKKEIEQNLGIKVIIGSTNGAEFYKQLEAVI